MTVMAYGLQHSFSLLEEDYVCDICFSIMVVPKTLPCGHTFCGACIDNLIRSDYLIECPNCRRWHHVPATGFTKNITVEKMIEKKKSMRFVNDVTKRYDMDGGKISQTQLTRDGVPHETPAWSTPSAGVDTPPPKVYPSIDLPEVPYPIQNIPLTHPIAQPRATNTSPPMQPAETTYVHTRTRGNCPSCHMHNLTLEPDICALICILLLVILLFPIGLLALLLLPCVLSRRCPNCNYSN